MNSNYRRLSLLSLLLNLGIVITAQGVAPEHAVEDGALRIQGVGPDNPVIYDNDWWFDVFDNNYLWAQVSLGNVNLRGNVVSRDMWDWQKGYHYSMDQSWQDAEKALKLARDSGLKNIPKLTRGAGQVLLAPESGRIDDTIPLPTAGSRLIVEEAKKASPEKPLLVIVGGPQTTVANALLTNPEIATNLVVFNLTVTGGYNGKDGWSAYIVAKRTRSVDWGGGEFWDKDSVFRPEFFEALPDNAFTIDMKRFIRTDLGARTNWAMVRRWSGYFSRIAGRARKYGAPSSAARRCVTNRQRRGDWRRAGNSQGENGCNCMP